jgi:short-subunit dehydrogenase
MEVRGAVVLVTGASAGIGRETALAFDRAGARVAMVARRAERLRENATRMRDALVIPADLADEAQAESIVQRTVDHFGRIDVLINNAGASLAERSDQMDVGEARRLLETNFIAAVVATRSAVRQMRIQGRGHVINVTSPGGMIGVPLHAAYAASKAAMTGWTRSLQAEWAGTGIFVTEYNPGLIATEMGGASSGRALPDASRPATNLPEPDIAVFQDPSQSRFLKLFNKVLPPIVVATHLVECVQSPRLVMYSGRAVRLGMLFNEIPAFRHSIGAGMARAMRRRMGIDVFSD